MAYCHHLKSPLSASPFCRMLVPAYSCLQTKIVKPRHMGYTHFPDPLPDENFYSLVCRIALINGFEKHRQVCIHLFAPSRNIGCVTGCPIDWQHFCQLCDSFYGTSYDVLSQLTAHRYFCFLNWPARTQGNPEVFLSFHFSHKTPISYLGKDGCYRWRFCKKCLAADLKDFGVSYWHRSHQLPSTFVCTKHLDTLYEVALLKFARNSRLFLPSDEEIQVSSVPVSYPPLSIAALVRLAVFGEKILAAPTSMFGAREVVVALQDASASRGILTSSGSVRREFSAKEFEREYFQELAIQGVTTCNELCTGVLQVLTGKYCEENWLGRAIAIDWLLGSFDALTQRIFWLRTMRGSENICVRNISALRRNTNTITDKEKHRQMCVEILRSVSSGGRTVVARKAYATYRWLLKHDVEWLDARCKENSPVYQFELF